MKNLDKYLYQIQEGTIFSDKTISIDLHKFKSGEKDKLLIVGFAGSGKTTLGRRLAKKYKCKYFELDDCWEEEGFLECSYNKIKVSKGKAVIEGSDIITNYFENYRNLKEFIIEQPIIILGKSFMLSLFRALKRDFARRKEIEDKKLEIWGKYNQDFKFSNSAIFPAKQFKTFRKERIRQKGSVVKIYQV